MATITSRYPMAQSAGELTRRTTLGALTAVVVALVVLAIVDALARLTDRPVRNFVAVSALVFVGMLVPVLVVAPSLGVTGVGQAVLVALHVVVAVPLVAFVVGAVRL
ncbi:hypothetical protein EGH21_10995 [Halomicroarcula sp. F13]|uniref:Uncharacterized protein n=1 Tax=Haloarcula rubra TaxID=2487747 RepID=A0AAW4PQT6_9EURY|nr:hypothetical protein [Halomicroarcula rubra]MBX0323556.1 hypothetical protein [Halomicroarcula rubra]